MIATTCSGCGRCVAACSRHALTLSTAGAHGFGRKSARVNHERCNGCNACLPACPRSSLSFPEK